MSEEIPLELIVALDVSQSMTPSIPVLKTSAKAFLAGLREHRILGIRTRDGKVLIPPLEYDPQTGDALEIVGVARDTSVQQIGQPDPPLLYVPWNPSTAPYQAVVRFAGLMA